MDPADLGVGGIERGVGGSSGGPEPVGVVGYAMRVQRRWAALIATLSSGVLISCVSMYLKLFACAHLMNKITPTPDSVGTRRHWRKAAASRHSSQFKHARAHT